MSVRDVQSRNRGAWFSAALGVSLGWALCEASPAAAEQQPETAASSREESFAIGEFRVIGSHVVDRVAVESAVYPFLGPDRTLKSVQQARDALVEAYRRAGYATVLVDIPEQSVDEGIVRLKVTEGAVGKVRVSGARYYSNRRILAALPAIAPGTVPRMPELQSELAQLANEAHDREIQPILKAGKDPGTVDIDLRVKDHVPLHGSIEVNNRYTADTSHTRLNASLSYDNLFQRGESVSLQYQTAPASPSQVQLWAVTYAGRTPSPDWTWSVSGIRSDSNVAALGTVAVIGNGKIFGGRLLREFGAGANSVNSLTFAVDYKDFGQSVVLPGDVSAATPIHYLIWSAQLATTRVHETYEWQNSLGFNFGWSGLVGNDADFEFKRSGASASYAFLRGSTRFTWKTWHGFAIMARLGLQYSEAPLVNNEQFSLGGADTVRGYLETEALVDSGLAATVELQFPRLTFGSAEAVGYLFYDRGLGMNQQPLESEVLSGSVRTDLASFGLGFHASPVHGMNASFEFADPRLTGTRTIRGDERVLFSVQYGF